MALVAHELKASYAFVERNFYLSRRYWGWELAFLVYSVAGALSISLIGAAAGDARLLLTLIIGAVFWNYLSVVFSWIAETIAVERWEGTLEYTFMAPVRRWTQLLGSCLYAMTYGLVHTAAMLLVMVLFYRELDLGVTNLATAGVFVLLGSFSFVGIGMMAAILPLLYVERGAQMTFVVQSCLLLVSGVYYPVTVLPEWMQALSRLSPATYVLDGVRAGLLDGTPLTALVHDIVPLIVMMIFFRQLDLSVQNVPTAMVFVVLGSFSFVGIGMMAAILPLLYVERGAQMTFVLQSCLLLVSGVYYPVEVLPDWMQVLSRLSPATYVLDGVRAGLLDGVPVSMLMHDVVPLVVMGIVLIPAGIWAFGRAERYAKRTGKLKRVG